MLARALCLVLLLAVSAAPVTAAPLSLPFTVTERAGTPRTAEVVTLGVPLPRAEDIRTTDGLRVVDASGRTVPAQFRVLSRWGPVTDTTRPIRWVLVDFEASLGAKATATYTLKSAPPATEPSGVSITDGDQMVTLDTGAMTVRIPKTGGYLFETTVGGQIYRTAGLRVLRGEDEFLSARAKPASVTVEEAGPLRTVVRIHGTYHTAEGTPFVGGDGRVGADPQGRPAAQNKPLEYTVWLTTYRAKSTARVRVRFENSGRPSFWRANHPSNDVFMDGVYLDTELPASAAFQVAAAGKTVSLSSGQRYSLFQTHTLRDERDESKNLTYTVTRDAETIATGSRLDGWLGVAGAGSALTVAVNRFWQNYPKSLEVRDGRLAVGLWPAEGPQTQVGPYGRGRHFFSGGWHKTHDLLFVYHGKDPRGTSDQPAVMSLLTPLAALPAPAWIASTGAWGAIAPSGLKSPDRELQEALDRYERYQRILIDPAASADGVTLERMREGRGAKHQARTSWYGWQDFGDIMHGGNPGHPSYLIYDWPYIMWLHYARSADPRFRQAAEELTDHSRDLDQFHSEDDWDGLWGWETGRDARGYHFKVNGAMRIVSHAWNGGYALGYLLTGDPTYLEAARRGAAAGQSFWEKRLDIRNRQVLFAQTRSQGWTILMLLNLYKIDGDPTHLDLAMKIFVNSLLFTECAPPPRGSSCGGYIPLAGDLIVAGERDKVVGTFATYHLEPLIELALEARAAGVDTAAIDQFLLRAVSWLKRFAYVGGSANTAGFYSALTLSYATDPANESANRGGIVGYNTIVASAAAYVAGTLRGTNLDQSQEYMRFARQLFRDHMFYREVRPATKDRFFSPATRSKIWWSLWPATAPKELGLLGRAGQFYLYTVWTSQTP